MASRCSRKSLVVACVFWLAAHASAFSAASSRRLSAPRRRAPSRAAPQMLDSAAVTGIVAAISGLGSGLALAYFSEQQIVRAEQRGSDVMSDTTRAKMSAMFMEDEVMPETGLDETVRRMEEALAAAKATQEPEAAPKETEPVAEKKPPAPVNDGGW